MAMSRSFGGTSVTSRSPIRMRPELTSSRPASIRSDVDLPQPDGPTRTMNSPSWISRSRPGTAGSSAPGYQRWAFSNVTVAMTVSPSPAGTCRTIRCEVVAGATGNSCPARGHRPALRQRRYTTYVAARKAASTSASVSAGLPCTSAITATTNETNVKNPSIPSSISRFCLRASFLPHTTPLPISPRSTLHTSGREPVDDPALEQQHHDDQRDRDHGARRHDGGVRLHVRLGAGEARDRHRDRLGVVVAQLAGDQELVPRRDEREDGRGDEARCR